MVSYIREGFSDCLYFVQGTIKQDQYITFLENRLIPQTKEWFPNDEDFIFMQDRATLPKEFPVQKNNQAFAMAWKLPGLELYRKNLGEKGNCKRDYNNEKKTN